ncbi:MAG: ExbD/TolR family protein [Calditrichaceae bacterium]
MKSEFKSLSEINVTNLVDVTMVLLIIFMITAPFMRTGIEVNLPETDADNLKSKQSVVVTLTHEGIIYLDEERITLDKFPSRLLHLYHSGGDEPVMLKADWRIPYGQVIELMGEIKKTGINNLGLMVDSGGKK